VSPAEGVSAVTGSATAAATVLDDPAAIRAADPGGMLAAVAGAGDQIRTGVAELSRMALDDLEPDEQPRSVVVAGMGGSACAGDVLAVVAGTLGRVPVLVHRGYGLPAWADAQDLVAAVSCSGSTEETLSAVAEAERRGIRVLTVGADDSPLATAGMQAGGVHLPVDAEGRQPRACLWGLATPLLVAADALGLAATGRAALAETADMLDGIAAECAPEVLTATNPAKSLAVALLGGLPVVWGFSEVAAVAALRFANQLAENAKMPAVVGALSEPHHNQVVAFDGPFGGCGAVRLHPVILRDAVQDARLAQRAVESMKLAADAGLSVQQVTARGNHRLVRLASLIGLLDFASVYLAIAQGIDPTPVVPIVELKKRLAANSM
jgi:glucose/mannose-6-phosphate isomerase